MNSGRRGRGASSGAAGRGISGAMGAAGGGIRGAEGECIREILCESGTMSGSEEDEGLNKMAKRLCHLPRCNGVVSYEQSKKKVPICLNTAT